MGPTGRTVAANLARLRRVRGFSTRHLASLLEEAGRTIPASGITRMESTERHVTVDELVALAAALRVAPSTLLLPFTDDPAATVEITGAAGVPADRAWDWMDGRVPLRIPSSDDGTAALEHALHARPPARRTAT